MNLLPQAAFQDNNLWLLRDGQKALVTDLGSPFVFACLQRERLQLRPILVTPHQADHLGGPALLDRGRPGSAVHPVFGHAGEPPSPQLIHSRA
jgi:hydroxyacylglutathione hydrolase